MLDYHLHLLRHGEDGPYRVEMVRAYAEAAAARGVEEICITEHLFRFRQADRLLAGWWDADPDGRLRSQTAAYWAQHATGDLEAEPDGDRRAVGRRAQYGVGVGVEIAGGVGGPVGGRLRPEPAVGVGVPPAAEQAVGLAEAEEVLGDADLLDAPGGGRLGVGAHRLDPVRAVLPVPQ